MSDSIDFEGVEVKPVGGVYKCPYECGDKRYSPKKWKTEKGFIKHTGDCWMRPSAVAARKEKEIALQKRNEEEAEISRMAAEEAISNCPRNVGDMIHYVASWVTKPTHVERGNRMVKVRYEEERDFAARSAVISSIGCKGSIFFNDGIYENQVLETLEEAKSEAENKRKSHQEYLNDCSSYR